MSIYCDLYLMRMLCRAPPSGNVKNSTQRTCLFQLWGLGALVMGTMSVGTWADDVMTSGIQLSFWGSTEMIIFLF